MSTSRMLKNSLLRSAPALRFPCCAWVPARALLARAFAGTNPCGCALPAALGHRPKPSVAWAFAGTSVHRTLALFRLTHWTVVCVRLTPLRRQVRGSSSVANPLSGIIPAAAHSLLRLGTGPSRPWLGRLPGRASTGHSPCSGSTPRSFIYFGVTPGFFSPQRKKRGSYSVPLFKHLRVRKMCGASMHRASMPLKIVFQEPASRCIVFAGSLNVSNDMQ